MKKPSYKMLSIVLVCCLCISLWSPVGTTVVKAEGNSSTSTESAAEPTTENTSGTTEDTTEQQDTYEIVLVNKEIEVETIEPLEPGATFQVSPKLKDSEENYVEDVIFTYTSSNEEVFTVSKDGLLTAKELSESSIADLTISWTNPEDETQVVEKIYSVTVNAVLPTGVLLEVQHKTLIVNESYTLAAKVEPATASQKVCYSSSDESVATIDEKGLITAKAVGTTTITVTPEGQDKIAETMEVEVIDIPVSLELNYAANSLKATDAFLLTAQVVYASGKKEAVAAEDLSFVSGDKNVVLVNEKGEVTALIQSTYPQMALVQVKYEFTYKYDGVEKTKEISESCQVTVTPIPVTDVMLQNKETEITLKINEKYTLLPKVLPENATNQNVGYKSSKTSVATVNSSGVITAKGIGEATITITSKENSSVKTTFKVKVYQTLFNMGELGINGKDTKEDSTILNKVLKYATLIDEPITVVVPDGTYYLNKKLTIYTDTNLCLTKKAVIKRRADAGDTVMLCSRMNENIKGYDQCKNITISGGVWDGNANGKYDSNCFYIGHSQNVVISDTTIKNGSGAHLIELAGVKNAVIENVKLYGYVKCTAKGYTASQADKEAIQLDYCSSISTPAMKPHDGTACKNITIRNCEIKNYMSGIGTHTAMSGVYSENINIQNNKFTNITNACINLRNFKDVTIKNNKASGFTTFLYSGGSTGTVEKNTITNKSFKKMTTKGLRAANGITVSNGSAFEIVKNKIQSSTSNGICVWNKSSATITNNTIKSSKLYGVRTQGSNITLKKNSLSKNKKGYYDTYKDATVLSSDDIRAYYINLKKEYKYTGKKIKPKITLKKLNKKYYKVTYKNNRNIGTATVTIKGKGKVKGTVKKTFKIVRKK